MAGFNEHCLATRGESTNHFCANILGGDLGQTLVRKLVWAKSFANFAWKHSFGKRSLGKFVWKRSFGFCSGNCCHETGVLENSSKLFGFGKLSLRNFRFVDGVWTLSLGNFRLGNFRLGNFRLGNFRLGNVR